MTRCSNPPMVTSLQPWLRKTDNILHLSCPFFIYYLLSESDLFYGLYFKKSKNDTRECSLSFDHLKKKWFICLYYQLTAVAVGSEYNYSKTWWNIIFKDLSFLSRCDSTLVALRGSVIVHIVSDKRS